MGDQRNITVTRIDRSYGVCHVDDKRRATYSCSIRVIRLDSQVFTGDCRRKPSSEESIHIVLGEAGVFQGIVCSLGVELQRRLVFDVADLIRLSSPNNCYGLR